MVNRRRAATKAAVLIVSALMLSALAACGTSVRVNGAEVDNKVPFLTVIESAWRDGSATDQHAQQASETHCWLLREPDSGTLQPRALCGPIRHLRDQGKPGVFDEVGFQPQAVGNKEVTVDPGSIGMMATGVEVPEGVELYRPDGKKPVPADQVPEPQAPKAEPGIVALGDPAQIVNAGSPKAGVIIAPANQLEVTRFGPVDRLPAEGEVPFYVPAEGEEFLAVTATIEPREHSTLAKGTEAAFSIRAEGKTTDLKGFFELDGGYGTEKADTKTIIVSVPKGKDAELVVGVSGVDQTISVRTGERTSKTAPAYYLPKTEFGVNKQFATQTTSNGSFAFQHGVTFTKAVLTSFDNDNGWAAEGQIWLELHWDNATAQKAGDHTTAFEDPTFDVEKTIQVTADGKAGKVIEGLPVYSNYSDAPHVLVQIPEGTKSIKVSYAPQGTFATDDYGSSVSTIQPKSGSFGFTKPLVFDLTLS
ncbi:hypothetical protein [Microlunatus sp. GCM10028923]|uniref:hypothetical protein n=1 Tax=Microlunatus sp. GCM10028923 TaxID=3273400 RepID=UPI00361E0431